VGNPIPVPSAYVPNAIPVPPDWVSNPIPIQPGAHSTAGGAEVWTPCVDVRRDDVLVAWQAGRGQIGRVFLTASGVEGEGEFLRGPNGSCQALLNAAARN